VGWLGDAGTSAAAPIWAGLIAIADQGRALAGGTPLTGYTQTLPALYSLPTTDHHDIQYGNNGDPAGPGYDLASGLGTPIANRLVPDLAGYQLPSRMSVKAEPPSTVAEGGVFGLTVQVVDSLGKPVTGGAVTVALGSNPEGAVLGGTLTQPVVAGLAAFSDLTLNQFGTGYTLSVTDSSIPGSLTTSTIRVSGVSNTTNVTVSPLPGSLVVGQRVTLTATVAIVGPGTGFPSGMVTVKEGAAILGTSALTAGGASVPTTFPSAGTQTITIAYGGDPFDQPTNESLTLTVARATPTVSWSNPANIIVGTPLGVSQLDASASLSGAPLPGSFVYSPSPGTVLGAGNGQVLAVTFTPTDQTDFNPVMASVVINVLPQPTPPPVIIVGEQPVLHRAIKKGKPVGKAVLTGFTIEFNSPLSATAAARPANYELDVITMKRVKKSTVRVLQAIKNLTVKYMPASRSVTLKLAESRSFPLGGRLKVFPGIANGSGGLLGGVTVFTITAGGMQIVPS
jgi:hypothetical protein